MVMLTKMKKINFSEFTGKGVKIAVVDSGVEPTHPKIGALAGGVALSASSEGRIVLGRDHSDCAGHGTACAGIIRQKAPEAELYSIRIFDSSLTTDGRVLVAALQWAIDQGIDVVNLSLGTTEVSFRDVLAEVCRRAGDAGTILVAAEHNDGRESYPAVFPEVIGVTAGKGCGLYGYFYRSEERIECVARGDAQRLCWLNRSQIMAGGTSFAAPHITGVVALIREAYPRANLEKVRQALHANALEGQAELVRETLPSQPTSKTSSIPSSIAAMTSRYHWIRKAALYPYNKEMHAFVRGRDLLGFDIVGIADPAGKGLAGKDAGEAIGIASLGICIVPRLSAALEEADSLILGYVDQLGRISKRDILRESIQTALEKGLHVFSFLPVPPDTYNDLYEEARRKGLEIAYPSNL